MLLDSGGITALGSVNYATSLAGTQVSHTRTRVGGDCYAGVYLKNDGVEYSYSNAGVAEGTNLGDYVDVGDAANLYVRCTLNSGTLDGANAGTGSWLQLNTSRGWAIADTTTTGGADTGNITLEIDTEGDGSNIIQSQTYALSADQQV